MRWRSAWHGGLGVAPLLGYALAGKRVVAY
jgi:hypothetical protein